MEQATATKNPFQYLIDRLGEEHARDYLLSELRDEKNMALFAMCFPNHVPDYPPDFHIAIWEQYRTAPKHVGGAAPRGFAKSTVTSVVYLAHKVLFGNSRMNLLISDTYTQAVDLMASLKDELEENHVIKWLFGDVVGARWAHDDIYVIGVTASGKRVSSRILALGAGMKVRGRKYKNFRPQTVIIDDLENDEAVQSKERREKLRKWLLRAVLPALDRTVGRVILIGTVLHKKSLLNSIIAEGADADPQFRSWSKFKYSAIVETDFSKAVNREIGRRQRSLWPEAFSLRKLIAMRDDPEDPDYIGSIPFAQEMQNNPLDEGQRIIQPEWVDESTYKLTEVLAAFGQSLQKTNENTDILGLWLAQTFTKIHSAVDPAISENETADYWAMCTIGITRACPICEGNPAGHIMQLDMLRFRESDPMNQVQAVIDNYQIWRPDKIRVEAVAYQAGLVKLIKREAVAQEVYMPLKAWKPLVSKVRRANVHSANFSGRIVHLRTDHGLYGKFREEIIDFPQADHDDMFDAYMASADVSLKRRAAAQTR